MNEKNEKLLKSEEDFILELIKYIKKKDKVEEQIKELKELETELTKKQLIDDKSIKFIIENPKIEVILESILIEMTLDKINDEFINKLLAVYREQISDKDRKINSMLYDKSKENQTKLIKQFSGLVKNIASSYSRYGYSFEDLFSVGNLGLLEAIKRFDIDRNVKFISYATFWIRSYISQEFRKNSRSIKIPSYKYDELAALKKYEKQFEATQNRLPTFEETMDYFGYTSLQLQELNKLMMVAYSLNNPLKDDDSKELGEFIPDEQISVEEQSEKSILIEEIQVLLMKVNLTDKERTILTKRFGLGGQQPMSLQQLADSYNVTRERIRQIEAKALKKLKNSRFAREFRVYVDSPNENMESLKQKDGWIEMNKESKSSKLDKIAKQTQNNEILPKENLFQILSKYSEEIVRLAVEQLPEELKKMIYTRFGKNLDECLDVDKEFITTINHSVISMVENKCIDIVQKSDSNEVQVLSRKRRCKSIYEIFLGHTKEEIVAAISKLPEEMQEIVYKKYGTDLEHPSNTTLTSKEKIKMNNNIKMLIFKILKDPNYKYVSRENKLTLFERFSSYSKEVVEFAVSLLPEESKQIIYAKFGKNLDECFSVCKDISKPLNHLVLPMLDKKCARIIITENGPKMLSRIKSIYEEFPEYTKEEIVLAISKLPEDMREIVYKKYGDDLEQPSNDILNNKEKNKFKNSIKKLIFSYLKDSNLQYKINPRNKNLFQRFNKYNEEIIRLAVEQLPEEAKQIIYNKFGKNLDECFDIDKVLSNKLNRSVFPMLKYRCISIVEKADSNENKVLPKRRCKSIYEIFLGYTKEELITAISKLPEEYSEIVYKKYGSDLEHPSGSALSVKERNKFNIYIKQLIFNYLKDPKYQYESKLTLFYRLRKYDEEIVRIAVGDLSQEQQNELHVMFGINLDGCFKGQIDHSLFSCIERRCKNISSLSLQRVETENIFALFNVYSKEDVKLAVSKLPEDMREIIHKKYGSDLETISDYVLVGEEKIRFYNHVLPLILKYLKNPNYIYREYKKHNLNLFERLSDYEPEIVFEAVQQLLESERKQLYLRYGETLKMCYELDHDQTHYINRKIIPRIIWKCKKIKNEIESSTETDIIPVTPSEGSNNEKLQNTELKNPLSTDKKTRSPEEIYNDINALIASPEFIQFAKVLNVEDMTLASIAIAFAYVNGTFNSLEEISNILLIDKQVLRESIKKILIAYKSYINDALDDAMEEPFRKHLV